MDDEMIRTQLLKMASEPDPHARARAEAEVAKEVQARSRPDRKRGRIAGLGVVLIVGLALTPPGQALAERLGDLVGIGDESSVTESNLRDPRLTSEQERVGPAIVTATGTILGTDIPFEIVGWAAKDKLPTGPVAPEGADSAEGTLRTCLGVVLPEQGRQETGKWCQGEDGTERVPSPFHVFGVGSSNEADFGPNAPYEFIGVTRPNVAEIVLTYDDAEGAEHEGETTLGVLEGELLERTNGTLPFGFFVADIPYDGLPRDKFGYTGSPAAESAVIRAYDDAGNELGSEDVGATLKRSREQMQRFQAEPSSG